MANVIGIMGESGSGKTSSIELLNPAETFVLKHYQKRLPFRTAEKNYTVISKDNPNGNTYASNNYDEIKKLVQGVDEIMNHIKYLVCDDAQYLMGHEFISRAKEKGYDKFTEIGQHFYEYLFNLSLCRDDLTIFVLIHSENDEHGFTRIKTIGKMLNEKISVDGMFTILLRAVYDNGYFFETQGQGTSTAKSPRGMFNDFKINNDLAFVAKGVKQFYGE